MSSFAWAIDFSTFPEDTKKHLTDWSQRTVSRTGFDEGRLIFVRKKKEQRTALYHNLRSLTRNWGVDLPEGSDWLHIVDLVKAEDDNTTPSSPEVAMEAPTPAADKSASFTPDNIYKTLLPPDYAEQVRRMIKASA